MGLGGCVWGGVWGDGVRVIDVCGCGGCMCVMVTAILYTYVYTQHNNPQSDLKITN